MRISDWSSDVCSSDLAGLAAAGGRDRQPGVRAGHGGGAPAGRRLRRALAVLRPGPARGAAVLLNAMHCASGAKRRSEAEGRLTTLRRKGRNPLFCRWDPGILLLYSFPPRPQVPALWWLALAGLPTFQQTLPAS